MWGKCPYSCQGHDTGLNVNFQRRQYLLTFSLFKQGGAVDKKEKVMDRGSRGTFRNICAQTPRWGWRIKGVLPIVYAGVQEICYTPAQTMQEPLQFSNHFQPLSTNIPVDISRTRINITTLLLK